MKIAIHLNNFFPDVGGGCERQTRHVAQELAARGHEVHIFTKLKPNTQPLEQMEGFTIHRIKRGTCFYFGTRSYIKRVVKEIAALGPDIFHEQTITGVGRHVKKKLGIPYMVWGRGNDVYRIPFLFKYFTVIPSLKNANRVVALTHHMKKELLAIAPRVADKTVVIPNGVSLSTIQPGDRDPDIRHLVTTGRLIEEKGVMYSLRAMKKIFATYEDVDYIYLGRGPLRKALENNAEVLGIDERIVFTGLIPHEKAMEIMKSAYALVFPTFHKEGFPNALLEALALGLPIIATDHQATAEIIEDGKSGLLVPIKDEQALAEKINMVLGDEQLYATLRQNARATAEKYDIKRVVGQIESLYAEIVEEAQ